MRAIGEALGASQGSGLELAPQSLQTGVFMKHKWFRPRKYKHFDAPVGEAFADKVYDPAFIENHAWSPLIHYVKSVKRYKPKTGKTEDKDRPIMFASHRIPAF